MRKKDLDSVRQLLSRRRVMQGMGAVAMGAACGDDEAGVGGTDDSSSGSSTIDPSSTTASTNPSTTDGSSSTSSSTDPDGSTTDVDPDSSSGGSSDSSTGEPVQECSGDGGLSPAELLAETDIIVVLVMENRSFDHYFGSATFLEGWQVDGLTGDETNLDLGGNAVQVFNMANLAVVDPPHGWDSIHAQWNEGAMDGFVTEQELVHPDASTDVMGYYVRDQLPIAYALAEGYTLCDRWFCPVLGPTWPNRFYLHSATSDGEQGNFPAFGLDNIWSSLADAKIPARNYYHDVPWIWGGYANPLVSFTDGIDEFFAAAEVGTLPQYVVIDPNFGLLGGGEGQNDDHPDANVTMGQILLAAVHEALAQSPQWSRCMLVITYDEHGGFYDHAAPPEATDELPEFRQLGVRVPAIVCGPQVRRGCVNSTQFDHVSILATATTRFSLPPLNARVTATNDLSSCIHPSYLQDPQPPIQLPKIQAKLSDLLATKGPKESHPELRGMIARGEIPIPEHRRGPNASIDISMSLIAHAQRLGVLKLVD